MSGCADVCLDHGYDRYNDFYRESEHMARKVHVCCECGTKIQPGTRYQRAAGKSDGDLWAYATCLVCKEIRSAFVCGSWIFGELWESIRDDMFPLWDKVGPLDCLAKLTTIEARDACRAQYAQWQGADL